MKKDEISLRLIKRKIKDSLVDNDVSEISKDILVLIQNSMNEILSEWIEASLKEFDDVNHFREIQGMKKLRRLDVNVFEITRTKLFIAERQYNPRQDRTEVIEKLSCCKAEQVEVV